MAIVRIGRPLRDFLMGTEPDPTEDPELYELVEYVQGFPVYPAGIELPERFWSDVWYYADLLDQLDPTGGERRSARAALADLSAAGHDPKG